MLRFTFVKIGKKKKKCYQNKLVNFVFKNFNQNFQPKKRFKKFSKPLFKQKNVHIYIYAQIWIHIYIYMKHIQVYTIFSPHSLFLFLKTSNKNKVYQPQPILKKWKWKKFSFSFLIYLNKNLKWIQTSPNLVWENGKNIEQVLGVDNITSE